MYCLGCSKGLYAHDKSTSIVMYRLRVQHIVTYYIMVPCFTVTLVSSWTIPMYSFWCIPNTMYRDLIYCTRCRVTSYRIVCSSFCPLWKWVETRWCNSTYFTWSGGRKSAIRWNISILGTSASLCLKLSITEIYSCSQLHHSA